jgi:hypothetical protein
MAFRMGCYSHALNDVDGARVVTDLFIIGNIACAKPITRQSKKLLNLMVLRENVRRTPSLWPGSPNYDKAIDAMKARMQ